MFLKCLMIFCLLVVFSCTPPPGRTGNNKYTIRGMIVDKERKDPVGQALVYTVKGNEEALSGDDGSFQFETWQAPPFKIYVEYADDRPVLFDVPESKSDYIIFTMQ